MKALFYKDFVTIKKSLLLVVLSVMLMGIYAYTQGKLIVLPLLFMILPMILLNILFGGDHLARIDLYLIPAPVERKTMVLSRYIWVWIFAAIGALTAIFIHTFSPEQSLPLPWYFVTAILLLLITGISAIQLPLLFKFDKDQAQILFVILYLIIFAFFSWLSPKLQDLFQVPNRLDQLPFAGLSIGALVLTVVLNLLSLQLSIRILKKKEF